MQNCSTNNVQAIIFDWAGTTVDYGCFSPLHVFIEIFKQKGIEVTHEEARKPMGTAKWSHINEMCQMERIANVWKEKFGKFPDKNDVDELYSQFEPMLFATLPQYCKLVPGLLPLIEELKALNIAIGSTTGYTAEMMEIVTKEAEKQGYTPDSLVTPNEVPAGRPYPWMIYKNAMNLGIYPLRTIVKVGDTISDIEEGVNAGVWTIGVIKGSNELGMTEEEVNACPNDVLQEKMEIVSKRFKDAGAHYVIDEISNLIDIIPIINQRLTQSTN
ncbi:phosphonoacetaldehyde hydrolase [Bacillus massiliigorillae]|uniref:phosphonoacetaldehyde hydrolase n=1 Tax=Bacillus massiliigorillae TaxID=1243664 RepID=UPI0003A4EAAA|nr:phosphonoacetaldehyde hydrolase [Bacillus massiliigorillae]